MTAVFSQSQQIREAYELQALAAVIHAPDEETSRRAWSQVVASLGGAEAFSSFDHVRTMARAVEMVHATGEAPTWPRVLHAIGTDPELAEWRAAAIKATLRIGDVHRPSLPDLAGIVLPRLAEAQRKIEASRVINEAHEALVMGSATVAEVADRIAQIRPVEAVTTARTAKQIASTLATELGEIWSGQRQAPQLQTRWPTLNERCGGWYRGQVHVVAARPGVGKTAIWEADAYYQAKNGRGVLVYSAEMSPAQHILRIAKREHEIPASLGEIQGQLPKGSRVPIATVRALGDVALLPIDFVAQQPGHTIEKVLAACDQALDLWGHETPPRLVVFDYLQLLRSSMRTTREDVALGDVSRRILAWAQRRDVAAIVISQLNRELERTQRDPTMADIRECGQLEQDASLIVMPTRDDTDAAKLHVVKSRHGRTGPIDMRWIGERMLYEEATMPHEFYL